MNKYQVNMVHPRQIVAKNLKGCKSSRTVTTFAQKNGVPWVWWKPTATQKVMLVDWTEFRTAWKQAGTTNQTTANNYKTYGNNKNYGNKQAGARNYTTGTAQNNTTRTPRTRRTTAKPATTRTSYRTAGFTRKRAA